MKIFQPSSAGGGATAITGTGGANQVAYFTGAQVIASSTNLQFNGTTLTIATAPVISSMTTGSVVFIGTSKQLQQDNANFFWDDTANALGIGTTTPTLGRLQVQNTTTDFIYMNVTNNNAASGIVAFNGGTQGNSTYLEAYGSTFAGISSGIARAGLSEFGANTNTALLIRNVANTNIYISTNDIVRINVTAAGLVGIGQPVGTAPIRVLDITTSGVTGGVGYVMNTMYNNGNGDLPYWMSRLARGTAASPTATLSGDPIGGFLFQGYAGSFVYGASIIATQTASTSTNAPTKIVFATANGTSLVDAVTVDSAQGMTVVGNFTDTAATLLATSSINSSGHPGLSLSSTNTQVVFGNTAPEANSRFTVDVNPTSYNSTAFRKYGANASGAGVTMYANRNASDPAAFTTVVADDSLGFLSFWGADGAAFRNAASIQCFVDGTPGSSDMPGRLVFFTTSDGSATALEALRLDNTQSVLLKQKITNYSNVATSGWGVPAIYASGRSTAQTTAVASVSTYTVGAADGSFEISANVLVTTSSAENFTVTCAYTDEGNTSRVLTLNFQTIAGVIGTAVNFANGTVPYEGILTHIRAKASTAITIATTGTFTGATYNVEGIIKQMK